MKFIHIYTNEPAALTYWKEKFPDNIVLTEDFLRN